MTELSVLYFPFSDVTPLTILQQMGNIPIYEQYHSACRA